MDIHGKNAIQCELIVFHIESNACFIHQHAPVSLGERLILQTHYQWDRTFELFQFVVQCLGNFELTNLE